MAKNIQKILVKCVGNNKIVNTISNNTFSIMSHHFIYLFAFNMILYVINLKWAVPYFDTEKLANAWIYIYEVPNWNMLLQALYVILGIGGPILGKKVWDLVIGKLKKNKLMKKW